MQGYATLQNKKMIEFILNLIRYDVPILMVGSSSIGKSYTILKLAEQWNIPHQILYVGSEKADNIEGLPKLTGLSESETKLKYLKPYWFPDADLIKVKVRSGRAVFDKVNATCYSNSFRFNYASLNGLFRKLGEISFGVNAKSVTDTINGKKISFIREINEEDKSATNELQDLCLFLSTMLGYGNYWLVLDELDKVDEVDADKYAPMLHIVRERILKDYRMQEINGGKGVNVAGVVADDYLPIYTSLIEHIDNDLSVVDTRVIGIANQSENINEISEALFRRFVQVIITDVLILKDVDEDMGFIKKCLASKQAEVYVKEVEFAYLDEINLQWLYGFLPKLTNKGDAGNFMREDFISTLTEKYDDISNLTDEQIFEGSIGTAFYKLLYDNFKEQPKLCINLTSCIYQKLTSQVNQKKNNEYFKGGIANEELREIVEKKKLNFDPQMIADDIDDFFTKQWITVVLNEQNRSRIFELDTLVRKYFEYVRVSCGIGETITMDLLQMMGEPSLCSYLIPKFIRFAFKVVLNDDTISSDDVARMKDTVYILLREVSKQIQSSELSKEWLGDIIAENTDNQLCIKLNEDEVKNTWYGAKDTFFGEVEQEFKIDNFQKSLFYQYYDRISATARVDYMTKVLKNEIEDDKYNKSIVNYLCLYYEQELLDYYKEKIKAMMTAKKMDEFKAYMALKNKFVEKAEQVKARIKE